MAENPAPGSSSRWLFRVFLIHPKSGDHRSSEPSTVWIQWKMSLPPMEPSFQDQCEPIASKDRKANPDGSWITALTYVMLIWGVDWFLDWYSTHQLCFQEFVPQACWETFLAKMVLWSVLEFRGSKRLRHKHIFWATPAILWTKTAITANLLRFLRRNASMSTWYCGWIKSRKNQKNVQHAVH